MRVKPGQAEAGPEAHKALPVSSSGLKDLQALVMVVMFVTFLVDAGKPFSVPATLP